MPYHPNSYTQSETAIGASNRASSNSTGMHDLKLNFAPRYGIITKIQVASTTIPVPFVKVRWLDTNKLSGWFPLEDHPRLISVVYATNLEDLVGYTVKVTRRSATDSSMTGRIVADTRFDPDQYDTELPSSGVKI